MSREEDDLISKLLNETYEGSSHPGSELSNQTVLSLADHFERRTRTNEPTFKKGGTIGKIQFWSSFIRIELSGQTLDLPKELSPFEEIERDQDKIFYEIKDPTFKSVLKNLSGEDFGYVVVQNGTTLSFMPNEETPLSHFLKKSAA